MFSHAQLKSSAVQSTMVEWTQMLEINRKGRGEKPKTHPSSWQRTIKSYRLSSSFDFTSLKAA